MDPRSRTRDIVYALTSTSGLKTRQSLRMLRDSTDGTGFVHESYSKGRSKDIYPSVVCLREFPFR
jgi:meiotically up-regulated gene 157 (Mug157) protein